MSSSPKMICTKCGKDVTVSGVQLCEKCDPGVEERIRKGEKVKTITPILCDKCLVEHKETFHVRLGPRVVDRREFMRCPKCGESGYNPGLYPCENCGHFQAIG